MIEDSELKCQYCNKIFTRRSSLHNHINKRTKGCLKIEEELKCKIEQDKVPCVFCKKVFTNKYTLEAHMKNRPTHCLNKELEDVNKELDDEKSHNLKKKESIRFLSKLVQGLKYQAVAFVWVIRQELRIKQRFFQPVQEILIIGWVRMPKFILAQLNWHLYVHCWVIFLRKRSI